jgi:hypothetical protein
LVNLQGRSLRNQPWLLSRNNRKERMVLVERKKDTAQKPKGLLIPLVRVD